MKTTAKIFATFAAIMLVFYVLNASVMKGPTYVDAAETHEDAIGGSYSNDDVGPFSLGDTSAPHHLPKHAIRNLCHEIFIQSITTPRAYEINGLIKAGVVPHHATAATMISGFFAQATGFAEHYDTIIILAPNHEGDLADIVLSYRDWDIGSGVFTHGGFVQNLHAAPGINTTISHTHIETDHSASIFIPYIYHYLPNTKVAPVLLNRSLSLGGTQQLFHWLMHWIETSGENVLLLASIDFSHFLTASEAWERDAVTTDAILNRDFRQIHDMNDHYLDSPAAMIIFLMYIDAIGAALEIADHANATDFLGPGLDETTSYKIIAGTIDSMEGRWENSLTQESPSTQENILTQEDESTQVRLTFVGDIMLHQAQTHVCFNHTFSQVRPHLESADITIGNLETVMAGHFSDFPLFSAPDEFGYALRDAGFDLLATANNHSLDQGIEGLLRSLDFLDSIGIGTFGTYRCQESRDTIFIREAGGISFAFLAYTFGVNGQPIPVGREYLVNLIHEDLIRNDIARARQLADIVIVMPHMGNEYELFVRPEFKFWAMLMLDAGADVVVAGHPHVVQPMGFVQIAGGSACSMGNSPAGDENAGEYAPEGGLPPRCGFVAYCLGNFVSSQREVPTDAGVMLNLYFERTGANPPTLAAASIVPTWVQFTNAAGQTDIVVLPISETLLAIDAGVNMNLRHEDIRRMREARWEITEIVLGVPLSDMRLEYFIYW